jgi:hypothetical protein
MTEIVVPIIATWMKFIVTPVKGFVSVFGMVWGAMKFFWCVQILREVAPPPPKKTRGGAVLSIGLLSVHHHDRSSGGILSSRPTHHPALRDYRQRTHRRRAPSPLSGAIVRGSQITRVVCRYGRYDVPGIADIYLYTTQGKERLTNGAVRLEPLRDVLRQHLSDEVMKRCQ